MKIISYNVNGIRAALRKNLIEWVDTVQPDILCLQETKALQNQVELADFEKRGYNHYWNSAQKKGYSGVAIFSKLKPNDVTYGTGIDTMDGEGRIIRADFDHFSVLSVYVPNGGGSMERLAYKMQFCKDFTQYIKALQEKIPNLIICGDFNICHKAIDIHDPVRNQTVSGFLPMEREWLSYYMESCGLVDSFRMFNANPHHYTWWSYRANARERNKGWRLDYHFVTECFKEQVKRCVHLTEAKHSDHCPVLLEIETQ